MTKATNKFDEKKILTDKDEEKLMSKIKKGCETQNIERWQVGTNF